MTKSPEQQYVMTDYKDTLNLPTTDFPMKANLPQQEPKVLKHWQEIGLYQQLRQQGQQAGKQFILHDGPPYANARPHLGTAVNKILKDIVVKSKTLSGYDAPYVPGWDCHGLPIELNVEKKFGKPGENLSETEFRTACRQYAESQVALQSGDFQRLGILGDWEHPYLTMDYLYEANTVRVLKKIVTNGHLHRGQKPVHWCTACKSALAEAEVEYREKSSPAIDVAFEAVDAAEIIQRFHVTPSDPKVRILVPIWTTTPWTLPANQAVALHPKLHYALVRCSLQDQPTYLVLAKDLVDTVMQRYGVNDYGVHGNITGNVLEGIQLQHPLMNRIVPIIVGEHVTTEAGTGNVHTAPAHGIEDYLVAEKYHLSVESPVNSDSCFIAGTPFVETLHVFKANEPILIALADCGRLLHSATVQHSYPHCWRHKTPLIFRATPQWFISMDHPGLRQMALEAIQRCQWIPAWGQTRITKMVADRPDWCISRQRTWGIPIPFFIHKETGELHPNTPAFIEKVATLIEKEGIEAWFQLDPATLLDDAAQYDKSKDVLDVWFDSGVTHYCVLEQRSELSVPADLYLEGSDQHRGWFQSSLLTSLAIRNEAPFRAVLTHGFVVDGHGRKMSKSLGNTILPYEVVKNMGADILRLWTAGSDHTLEMNVSDEILQRNSEAYRRIRNTARFLLSNLNDFDPKQGCVSHDHLVALDRWMIHLTAQLQQKILMAYEKYRFQTIYQLIHNFCTVEMGSFYLDIIKDRVYTSQAAGLPRRSAQTALYHMTEALVRWLAPILSFTAEEIWQHMPGKRAASVFLTHWHQDFPAVHVSDKENEHWQWLMRVRNEVNKVLEVSRATGKIGSSLQAEIIFYADAKERQWLTSLNEELRYFLITSDTLVLPKEKQDGAAQETSIPGLAISVNVSTHKKCIRCWQYCHDIGADADHAALCVRCVTNVYGQGEVRKYV